MSEGEVESEAITPLPELSFKAKLRDGTVVASGLTAEVAFEGACAYYTAIMIINPIRLFQIGIYNAGGIIQAVIGRGT
jgi:hypothetical protein